VGRHARAVDQLCVIVARVVATAFDQAEDASATRPILGEVSANDRLNQIYGLLFAPFTLVASITAVVVGFHAWWSWRMASQLGADDDGIALEMGAAVNYAIARSFVASIFPFLYCLYLSMKTLYPSFDALFSASP
jgi:hypothetical protein